MRQNSSKPVTVGKGQKYKTKQIEPRGKQDDESRMQKAFWKDHKMEDVITWTAAELEEKLEAYFQAYQDRQIKLKPKWWWPEDPAYKVAQMRSKPKSKYQADPFNGNLH